MTEVILDTALEYTYVSFTSVEDDLLLNYGYSLKLLRIALAYASLKAQLDVDPHTDLIKSAIEIDRIYRDARMDYARALCSDGCGMLYYLTSEIGEMYYCILIAILIPAGVKHTISIDAYRLARNRRGAITSDIRHYNCLSLS